MSDPEPASPLLTVAGLSVTYGGAVRALRDVSLVVPERAVVAVLGNNGAGKSTLLRAISGTLSSVGGAVDAGAITFQGRSLDRRDPAAIVRSGVVQVPEGRRIFGGLTVDENLRAGGYTNRSAEAAGRARQRVLELFPVLAERGSQKAGLLSGGEQQMLAIGRALMTEPTLLLLDEPSLGLAPKLVERIGEVIEEINRQGTSVLLIEQNAAMGLRVADEAFVLEAGVVTVSGRAGQLATTDEVRDRYLGHPTDVREREPAAASTPQRHGSRSAATDALEVDQLSVRFGGIAALAEVSFRIEPGTIHALIGPNGAGKSTCINVLSGVYRATSGEIRYGGRPITRLRPHAIAALGISRTFQNLALTLDDTVEENLLFGRHRLMRSGVLSAGLALPGSRRERRVHLAAVHEVVGLVGLGDLVHREVHTLAYGDRKRVELARALCAEPGLLLLDEPVAGMTQGESSEMAAAITTVQRELGISIVVVEHDMPFVMGMADRVTVLDFGRVIADDTPEAVQRHPDVVQAYLGAPA